MSASINKRFSNQPQSEKKQVDIGFSWGSPAKKAEPAAANTPAGEKKDQVVNQEKPVSATPNPVQPSTAANEGTAPKNRFAIDFGLKPVVAPKPATDSQQKPAADSQPKPDAAAPVESTAEASIATEINDLHTSENRYALMSIYAPIVTALAHEPDFQSLSSTNKKTQESAGQVAHKLMAGAARAVGVMKESGLSPSMSLTIANKIISDAWRAGADMNAAIENLGKYTARFISKSQTFSIRNSFIGMPSLKEISMAEQGADNYLSVQSGVSALFSGIDSDLVDWFIDEVRGDRVTSVISGLNAADEFMKNDVSTAFMSEGARLIVRMAAAAALSHADNIYVNFTEQVGERFITTLMGQRNESMIRAKKSIVSAAIDAVDTLRQPDTGVISDISVAQAIGSMINEIGKPWLNSRIAIVKAAWNAIPPDQRKGEKLAPDFVFTEKLAQEIGAKSKLILDEAQRGSKMITGVVPLIANPDHASSQIKTRSALVKAGLNNEMDIRAIEKIIETTANKATAKQKPKSVAPTLSSKKANEGIHFMTVCSVLREVSRASISGLIRKTGAANIEMVANSLVLAMDGMQLVTRADMSDIKTAINESVRDMYLNEDSRSNPSPHDTADQP